MRKATNIFPPRSIRMDSLKSFEGVLIDLVVIHCQGYRVTHHSRPVCAGVPVSIKPLGPV